MNINIGIDLDETLIKNRYTPYNTWHIKRDVILHLHKLYNKGYKFYIITARSSDEKLEVESIISQIEEELGVKIESITYTNGGKKCTIADKLNCKYIIDDNKYFLSDYKNHKVIPILLQRDKDDEIISFRKWEFIVKYLLNIN